MVHGNGSGANPVSDDVHNNHHLPKRLRLGALAVALSVGAAACGSSATDTATGTAPDSATNTSATDTEAADSSDAGDDAVSQSQASSDDEEPAADPESDQEVAPVENLFPDVDVVTVAGAELNLSEELAGGDKAVLLWFWAPH